MVALIPMLQALPANHPVQQSYAADLASRQQLAAVSGEALLAAGAVRHKIQLPATSGTLGSNGSSSSQEATQHETEDLDQQKADVEALQMHKGAVAHTSRRLQHLAQQAGGQQQQQQSLQETQQQQQRKGRQHLNREQEPTAVAGARYKVDGAAGGGVRQYTCGSWQFELDEAQGAPVNLLFAAFHSRHCSVVSAEVGQLLPASLLC
jgi:hypothetical protein